MLQGFNTKEKIKSDWFGKYGEGISDFSTGAERIVYALFNGKGIGQPNSSPVGSDLFFEVEDAFIHIDLKSVQTESNLGDYTTNIFVGENQNSYAGKISWKNSKTKKSGTRSYKPALPTFYTTGKGKKICLTYFVTILYEKPELDILNINIICMPNGALRKHYKDRPLQAGKNPGKARFRFTETPSFELLPEKPSRVKVIYYNKEKIHQKHKDKLAFFEKIYNSQNNN